VWPSHADLPRVTLSGALDSLSTVLGAATALALALPPVVDGLTRLLRVAKSAATRRAR
jgi:hypothetical protein